MFPYPDAHFATVICGELIEHLFEDPMHLMSEVNRILKPGGHLVLTTPNIARAARHLGNPAGLPSRILPRLHPAGGRHGRGRRAAQSRIRAARDSPTAGELRLRSRTPRRPASSATSRIPSSAGFCTCWSATASAPNCAATASTPWAERPARCASAIPRGCIVSVHERT